MPALTAHDVTSLQMTPPGVLPPDYATGPAITKPPLHTPLRTFTTRTGRTFAVRVMPANARYGRNGSRLTALALVEFYDTTYADDARHGETTGFGPLGQFVTHYTFGDLIQHEGTLDLRTETVWKIDAATMREITHWLADPHTVTCTVTKTYQTPETEHEKKNHTTPEKESFPAGDSREAS